VVGWVIAASCHPTPSTRYLNDVAADVAEADTAVNVTVHVSAGFFVSPQEPFTEGQLIVGVGGLDNATETSRDADQPEKSFPSNARDLNQTRVLSANAADVHDFVVPPDP